MGRPLHWYDAQCYGFTEEESGSFCRRIRLLSNEAKRLGLSRRQQIHHVFSKWRRCATHTRVKNRYLEPPARHPSTEEAKLHLIALGMGENDTEALYKAIMRQYNSKVER